MRFSFANREHEVRELSRFLSAAPSSDSNRVCLVSGPSGIGKSRVVDEAVRLAAPTGRYVRMPVKQSDFRCGESGFFLRATAIAVGDAYATNDWGVSLEQYEHVKRGGALFGSALGAASKTLEKIATGQAEISKDVVATWQKRSSTLRDLLGRPSTEALQLAYSYLKWVLSDVNGTLIVESSQLIDAESLHFICALAQENFGLRLVFEYTTGADPSGPAAPFGRYDDFLQAFRDRSFNFVELHVLAIDFDVLAQKNFQSEDPKFVEILRRELKARSGNVRDLERLQEVTSKSIAPLASLSTVTIEGALARFSTHQKLILWIIALSRRSLDPYELAQIATFIPASLRPLGPTDVAKSLIPFVELERGSFAIDHDSLLERLYQTPSILRECLVAASAVAAYFRNLLERSEFAQYSEYEILFALLWLSRPLNSTDLIDLAIARLSSRVKASGRPGSLLRLVHDFADRAQAHALHRRTVIHLIKIVYDACWIEGALDLTEKYRTEATEISLCHCQALSIAGRHNDAENELVELLSSLDRVGFSSSAHRRMRFYVDLVGVFIARVRGDYELARGRYMAISSGALAASDQCVYYRFGEVADVSDTSERLAMAVSLARRYQNHSELARGAVVLAMINAEAGLVKEAKSLLDEAESCKDISYVDTYMIANNRLVVEILSEQDFEGSYRALHGLLPLVIESMDRLLITNNLLAAAALSSDIVAASKFEEELEAQVERVVEKNMRRITYFNLSRFHASHGSSELAREYGARAFRDHIAFDEAYWQLRKTVTRDARIDFRLSCEFDLPMMSNWYFTWPDFGERSE